MAPPVAARAGRGAPQRPPLPLRVRAWAGLCAGGMQHEACYGAHDYALRHRELIARFGRIPHRNAILGRESTVEEIELLKQPGSSF